MLERLVLVDSQAIRRAYSRSQYVLMAGRKPPIPHTYLACHDSCFPRVDACQFLQYQDPYGILPVCFYTGVCRKRFAFGSEAGFRKACCLTTGRVGNLGGVFLGVDRLVNQVIGWIPLRDCSTNSILHSFSVERSPRALLWKVLPLFVGL